MKINKNIYNEDCFVTMDRIKKNNVKCDVILTSPLIAYLPWQFVNTSVLRI